MARICAQLYPFASNNMMISAALPGRSGAPIEAAWFSFRDEC
jgi:hypothetical protein